MNNEKGFLLHAFKSRELDYAKLAVCCALSIKTNLKNNNVTLIADEGAKRQLDSLASKITLDKVFDEIVISKEKYQVSKRLHFDTSWHTFSTNFNNHSRILSYNYSPYNETILLDTDFIVMNESFDDVWGSDDDLLINKKIIDLKGEEFPDVEDKRVSKYGIPLYWATIVYFRKSKFTETFFGLVEYIRENYDFYQFLYGFKPGFYRNDFSFSIALHILNGYKNKGVRHLPEEVIRASYQKDSIVDLIDSNEMIFLSHNVKEPWKNTLVNIKDMNIHIMNKRNFLHFADKFIDLCLEKL